MERPGYEYFIPEFPPAHILAQQQRIESLNSKERYIRTTKKWRLDDKPKDMYSENWESMERFDNENPQYPDYSDMVISPTPIKKGKEFNVIRLLSSYGKNLVRRNGDELNVEKLRGKYIMVCCFLVPFHWWGRGSTCVQDIAVASQELSVRDDFEMVVVAKMRHDWANDEQAFQRFISGFSCLAVPFLDSKRRDYICMSLNLLEDPLKALLVDPHGKVLQDDAFFFSEAGGNAFPFTDEKIHSVYCDYFPPWESLSLEGLLGCKCNSDYTLYNSSGDASERIRVSELKEKVVGLYLCCCGYNILKLWEVYQQCKTKGLGFEIVLVYMPFNTSMSLKLLQELINGFLEKYKISWWVLPFNNSVCRRLWKLCRLYNSDELIIVGPHDEYVDLRGGGFLHSYGIDAYPFTREHIIQKELQRIRELTLKSVLALGSQSFVCHRINCDDTSEEDKVVDVVKLEDKHVLLYLYYSRDRRLYDQVTEWYESIKKNHPTDFEVVVVHINPKRELKPDDDKYSLFSSISKPWLVCPVDIVHSDLVVMTLFNVHYATGNLVAFGDDGRICSMDAEEFLRSHGPAAFPFKADMRKEVIIRLASVENKLDEMLY